MFEAIVLLIRLALYGLVIVICVGLIVYIVVSRKRLDKRWDEYLGDK